MLLWIGVLFTATAVGALIVLMWRAGTAHGRTLAGIQWLVGVGYVLATIGMLLLWSGQYGVGYPVLWSGVASVGAAAVFGIAALVMRRRG